MVHLLQGGQHVPLVLGVLYHLSLEPQHRSLFAASGCVPRVFDMLCRCFGDKQFIIIAYVLGTRRYVHASGCVLRVFDMLRRWCGRWGWGCKGESCKRGLTCRAERRRSPSCPRPPATRNHLHFLANWIETLRHHPSGRNRWPKCRSWRRWRSRWAVTPPSSR